MTPDNNPDRTPSSVRHALGLAAGAITAAAVYGAEAYVGYVGMEVVRAAFQSPDGFTSTVGVLSVLGIMFMLLNNRGEFPRAVLASGFRAGQAVHNEIVNSLD